MLSEELTRVILGELELDAMPLEEASLASEVPGWDSLSHARVIAAVEAHFGVRFTTLEMLRLKNLGDLQKLVDSKARR